MHFSFALSLPKDTADVYVPASILSKKGTFNCAALVLAIHCFSSVVLYSICLRREHSLSTHIHSERSTWTKRVLVSVMCETSIHLILAKDQLPCSSHRSLDYSTPQLLLHKRNLLYKSRQLKRLSFMVIKIRTT